MSAPDRPRYVLRSVTGYGITAEGKDSNEFLRTGWHISDSWCNYTTVFTGRTGEIGRDVCERIAVWMEAEDLGTLPKPHGTRHHYDRHGCRCDLCKAAATYDNTVHRNRRAAREARKAAA